MRILRFFLAPLAALLLLVGHAQAHALEPGFLDIRQLTTDTWQVFWRKPDVKGQPMAIDAQLPEICTPASGPRPHSDGQAWVSDWVSRCSGDLAGKTIRIKGLEAQNTDVLLRLHRLDTAAETYRFTPDTPQIRVTETPTTWGVIVSYTQLGFEHILEGWDHLLFVFALLFLVRDPWRLFGAITSFTVAHSITLALASLELVSIPGPPVEAIIALSIVFLASEILQGRDGRPRLSQRNPWVVCFAFGLLHGLGFAGALRDIGLPQEDIFAALLAFNIGVEAGQIAFVAAVISAFLILRWITPRLLTHGFAPHALGTAFMGYAIGGVATLWLVERLMGF